jgi:methyl-accepting chemotaxis protein
MGLSLVQRFTLLCVPLVFAGAGVGFVTWHSLQRSTADLSAAHRVHTWALEARYQVSAMSDAMKSVVIDPQNTAEVRRKADADARYGEAMEALTGLVTEASLTKAVEALEHFDHTKLHPNENVVMAFVAAGNRAEAERHLRSVHLPLLSEFNGLVSGFEETAGRLVAAETARVDGENARAVRIILGSMVGGVGLVALFILFGTRRIAHRVRTLEQALTHCTGGITRASGELTGAGGAVAEGASRGAACLQGVAAAAEEVASMTESNAEHARQAAELAAESNRDAARGEAAMDRLRGGMDALAASARRIDEVTHVIDDVAFQTNLLALNAAVEAARAGEHGAGFAVVADAVRALAQRSASAAHEINGLIREVVERTDAGRSLAHEGGRALHDIVASTRSLSELSRHIADATAEQASAVAQISASVAELDADGHQNAAVAEEMAASALELNRQAGALSDVVAELQVLVEGEVVDAAASSTEAPRGMHPNAGARVGTRPRVSASAPRNSSMGARGRAPARSATHTPSRPSRPAPGPSAWL